MGSFTSFDLHDATLTTLALEWAEGVCTATFERWSNQAQKPLPCVLRWEGVTDLAIPRSYPWGRSASVNATSFDGQHTYEIEMQSGDRIKITAERVVIPDESAA
jgi:hypothetical protein